MSSVSGSSSKKHSDSSKSSDKSEKKDVSKKDVAKKDDAQKVNTDAQPKTSTPKKPTTQAQSFQKDVFEKKKTLQGPDLSGGTTTNFEVGKDGAKYSETTPGPNGTQTDKLSVGGGKITVCQENASQDGSKSSTTVSVSGDSVSLGTQSVNPDGSGGSMSIGVGEKGVTVSGSATPVKGITESGSVTVSPDGVGANAGVSVGNDTASVKIEVSASLTNKTSSQDGYTTATAQGSISVKGSGSLEVAGVELGASANAGTQTTYEVKMKDEDYAKVQAGQAPTPDPYNPDTMPVGSSIKLDTKQFVGTSLEAGYQKIGMEVGASLETGASIVVEKTGPTTVRVTVGPKEAMETTFKAGVGIGPAEAALSNETRLDQSTQKTAEFDLSTPEGKAAYDKFLATGELPADNGPGVKNVATIETAKYDSTTSAEASLGPLGGSLPVESNQVTQVRVTYPDGSQKLTTQMNYESSVPVTVEQHFTPDGKEDLSKQKITVDLTNADPGAVQMFADAFGGAAEFEKALAEGKGVKITFTYEQAKEFQERAQEYVEQKKQEFGEDWLPTPGEYFLLEVAEAKNPTAAVATLGLSGTSEGMIGETLQEISMTDNGREFFEAEVTVQ